MGKRPTPAAWKRMLLAYEEAYNALMADELQPHERDGLITVHTLLRVRASGQKTS